MGIELLPVAYGVLLLGSIVWVVYRNTRYEIRFNKKVKEEK